MVESHHKTYVIYPFAYAAMIHFEHKEDTNEK